MKITPELIAHHHGRNHPDQSDVQLAGYLHNLECTARKVAEIRDRKAAAERAHRLAITAMDAELAAVHRDCRHPTTKWHADPAGGSDSWDECLVCGATI
ncbi:hypothetical protein [Fimbriiglobus ruber]|uniref:Uncharacterized protein n=1 Tax=Fimbriiglobus ruber TaxID=1908690 RepID=A0A225CYD6_9BACT|nr:hypothetical protein [Fimbriiglobus ruber]OWK34351.1 hypothetical protein FRUB_10322 [Fimbriiglobus ruber]